MAVNFFFNYYLFKSLVVISFFQVLLILKTKLPSESINLMLDLCLINNADLYMYILPPEFFISERKKKFNDINKCELVFFSYF